MIPAGLWRGFLRDLTPRAAAALAAGLLLLAPLLRLPRPAAGDGAAPLGPILLGWTLLLFAGVVSGERRDGGLATLLARPVSRPGWFLARWLARLVWVGLIAAVLGILIRWRLGGPGPLQTAAAALVEGVVAGALVFLLSAVTDRGDSLLALAVLLAESGLRGAGVGGGAALWPLPPGRELASVRGALLAGHAPEPAAAVAVAAWSALVLGAAVWSVGRRPLRR